MQRIFPERCGRCSGGLPLWRVFLYRIAILFFPQAPCVAKAPVFPNSICASYPAAAFLPFFARPFCKKADSPRSPAATGPCRSHRVNDTPASGALPLCSALRLPVSALGFPPHFCPDTTTRPFPLRPAPRPFRRRTREEKPAAIFVVTHLLKGFGENRKAAKTVYLRRRHGQYTARLAFITHALPVFP